MARLRIETVSSGWGRGDVASGGVVPGGLPLRRTTRVPVPPGAGGDQERMRAMMPQINSTKAKKPSTIGITRPMPPVISTPQTPVEA